MQTLTKGYLKPQTGDKGDVFFPALETDIQQINDHTHTGSDSQRLTSAAVTAVSQSISSAGWGASGSGYRQLVTVPGTMLYDEYIIVFRDQASPKPQLHLGVEKVSSNTYYVYCNDNTLSITAFYLG